MKMMLLIVAGAVLLAACETVDIEEAPGPDGEMTYEATCYDEGMSPCMRKAASVCKGGKYEMLSRSDSSAGGLVMSGGLYVDSTATRLLFRCKDGPRKTKTKKSVEHEMHHEEDYRLSW